MSVAKLVWFRRFGARRCPGSREIGIVVGLGKRTLSTEELARDVQLLAADNDDLLAVEQLCPELEPQVAS